MDLDLLIPTTVPQVITHIVKVVDIGLLIPPTLPQVITEVVDIGQVRPCTLPLVIMEDKLIEVDVGHKIPANLSLAIR